MESSSRIIRLVFGIWWIGLMADRIARRICQIPRKSEQNVWRCIKIMTIMLVWIFPPFLSFSIRSLLFQVLKKNPVIFFYFNKVLKCRSRTVSLRPRLYFYAKHLLHIWLPWIAISSKSFTKAQKGLYKYVYFYIN